MIEQGGTVCQYLDAAETIIARSVITDNAGFDPYVDEFISPRTALLHPDDCIPAAPIDKSLVTAHRPAGDAPDDRQKALEIVLTDHNLTDCQLASLNLPVFIQRVLKIVSRNMPKTLFLLEYVLIVPSLGDSSGKISQQNETNGYDYPFHKGGPI